MQETITQKAEKLLSKVFGNFRLKCPNKHRGKKLTSGNIEKCYPASLEAKNWNFVRKISSGQPVEIPAIPEEMSSDSQETKLRTKPMEISNEIQEHREKPTEKQ